MKKKIKQALLLIESALGMTIMITAVSYIFLFTMNRASAAPTEPERPAAEARAESTEETTVEPYPNGTVQEHPFVPALEAVLVLVNENNALPDGYEQTIVSAFDREMDQRIVQPFTEMREAAAKDGLSLWISSGYRSVDRQDRLFSRAVETNRKEGFSEEAAEAKAAVSVARPGHSEHNTGLALDLNGVKEDFDTTGEYAWLQDHAAEYGFVLRYPADKQEITGIRFEPWHYRYVGEENAAAMKRMNLCLEEYVDYLRAGH